MCVSKGYTGHVKILDSKSIWQTTNELDLILAVVVKRERKSKTFKSVMSYESYKEWSKCIANLYEWPPSCCIHPCIQLHNLPLRPGALGRNCEPSLFYIREIEEMELDKEWLEIWAIYIESWSIDLNAVYFQQNALECNMSMSFIAQITFILVKLKLSGLATFGCK